MTRILRAALAAVMLVSGGVALADPTALQVEAAWVRAAPPGAMMLAGYASLRNGGDTPVTLVGARSTKFGLVEIHRTVEIDGVARMREATPLTIAAGETLSMAPGGLHVMLMRPTAAVAEGETLTIELLFDDGAALPVVFPVRKTAP